MRSKYRTDHLDIPPLTAAINYIKKISAFSWFARGYAAFGVSVLLLSTIFWALLGAKLQAGNADQLINSYLFDSPATFHSAFFPSSHSFLVKWPIFLLIKSFGYSSAAFVFFTLALTLIAVMVLAAMLYRLDRRPLVFGTLCLGLASALLLVPAEPAIGNLLPVNMAMIATRNLEYVMYIAALWLLVRPSFKSPKFWGAVLLLGLLIASDKLFLSLTVGGALLALVAYALFSGWNMVSTSVKWLMAGAASVGLSAGLLFFASHHLTHISSQSSLGPYGLAHSAHDFYIGAIYALLGLLTNFGANPAFDTTVLRNIPHQALSHLVSLAGPALLLNIAVLLLGIYASLKLLVYSFAHNKNREIELSDPARLVILLIWSMLAAIVVFIASNHYYAGDARYLTISLFSIFMALALFSSQKNWRPEALVIAGFVITAAIALAIPTTVHSYNSDKAALAPSSQRNQLVAQALARHPVKVLVGDYWRVIPTKFIAGNRLNVLPLSDCTQIREVLSSKQWQTDLKTHSFAYLLSLDGSQTDYPNCTLQQVINNYGRPNASVVIAGDYAAPKELLLFYDKGANKSAPRVVLKSPSTVVPVSLEELPYTTCNVPTIMNIVAHQDDDLLFMSPDLLNDIKVGHCVRTVYMTAGDAGSLGQFYWLSREQGSQAAYSKMTGSNEIWIQRVVKLADNEFITVANPRGNPKISLIFMHLPDGNLKGQGFPATHFESLAALDAGRITSLGAIYSGSTYNVDQIKDALAALMHIYQPTEIRTQANFASGQYPDHSDHMAVGRYVKRAYAQYETQQYENKVIVPIKYYIGYPVHQMPENVSGGDLQDKEAAFFAYSMFDGGVCHSDIECAHQTVYGFYLKRQYQNQE